MGTPTKSTVPRKLGIIHDTESVGAQFFFQHPTFLLFVAQVANRSGSNLSKQPQRQLDHSGSLSVVSLKLSLAIRPPLQDCQ